MHRKLFLIPAAVLALWLSLFTQVYAATPPAGNASLSVVDLYHGDTVNDWAALRGSVQALYIKATEGTSFTDPKAGSFAGSAQAAGLPYGFYHYLWPRADASYGAAQADYFYGRIRNYPYACVPAVDVEESAGLSGTVVSANVRAFAEEFHRLSGQSVMIYAGRNFINHYFDSSLGAYRLWIAQYGVSAPGGNDVFSAYTMWQYTNSLQVAGISQPVDGNLATNGIFLSGSSGGASGSGSGWIQDVYRMNAMPYAWNAVAGANMDVMDRNGSRVPGRLVETGDRVCILGVDYAKQLVEIVYPLNSGGYAHGYVLNRQDLFHNRYYMRWQNGSTNEPVYDTSGARIGTIFPYEHATPLYSVKGGMMVLYNTTKGTETKSGIVYYKDGFSF